ncbi:MAG: hypothetical protein ACRDN8_20155, partial [Thermoleophilaceae bacterium]
MSGRQPNLRVLPGGAPAADPDPQVAAANAASRRTREQAFLGHATHRPRGIVGGALAAASSFLLEPAVPEPESFSPTPTGLRPLVAVFGLARGCGVTVVSRALAAELAGRDVEGAAAVHCDARAAGIP